MRIKPFRALRPARAYASRIACVPYDTVSRAEAAALAKRNPLSFLHVSRAEIDLPEEICPYDESVYEKALANLRSLRKQRVLVREKTPHLYLYRMKAGEHVQTGIMACCHVEDYARNIIRKHENTRKEKEFDRTRLTLKLNAHTGPVLLTYRDLPDIDREMMRIVKDPPLYELVAPDGVLHTLWKIRHTAPLVKAFENVSEAYIADGHHRAAAALGAAIERRASSSLPVEGEWDWFQVILFPASRLRVLPYNRCVSDLRGMTNEDFLNTARAVFTVAPNALPSPARPGHVSMYLDGQWHDLDFGATPRADDPVAALDVSILHSRLLDPVLGIHDPRTDSRIIYVGGDRGPEALKKFVDSGQAAVAFSMFPVTVNQLMAVADAGGIMPPKSTWFDPKPRSGLLIHTF